MFLGMFRHTGFPDDRKLSVVWLARLVRAPRWLEALGLNQEEGLCWALCSATCKGW
eukprot:SAG31_NODE_690_length_12796_cov_4.634559_12_plen_56_part_00